MKRSFHELSVALALGLILLLMACVAPGFFQAQPLRSLATREAVTLIVACGTALVIINRQIDISVGSQFAVCSVTIGMLAAMKWPLGLLLPASILLGAAMGAINGTLVAGLGLPSIVVTLATMVTWREGLRWFRQGEFINLPDDLQWFGLGQTTGQILLIAGGFLLFLTLAWMTRHLVAARWVYAVGSDAEAARLAGLRPRRVTLMNFVFNGALIGLAAMMNVAQSPQVDPKSGTGLELKAIAAAVIGGVAISGGRGNLWGVLAGVLLLGCIGPALTHLHIEPHWEKAIQGGIILIAVIADGWRNRRSAVRSVQQR